MSSAEACSDAAHYGENEGNLNAPWQRVGNPLRCSFLRTKAENQTFHLRTSMIAAGLLRWCNSDAVMVYIFFNLGAVGVGGVVLGGINRFGFVFPGC